MAGLIPLGAVIDPSRDIFPTTGAHLDVRVIPQFGTQKGKKIDPKTARTVLQNVLIGENKTPLVQQQGQEWKWNFPITSGYGGRSSPTAGASSFHEGIDIGVGAGTPLTYKGYGSYTPQKGYGSLATTDPQGNPYEIRFLHTEPGKKSEVAGTASALSSSSSSSSVSQPSPEDSVNKLLEALGLVQKQPTMKDMLMGRALEQAVARRQQMEDLINLPQASFLDPSTAMGLFA